MVKIRKQCAPVIASIDFYESFVLNWTHLDLEELLHLYQFVLILLMCTHLYLFRLIRTSFDLKLRMSMTI